MSLAAQFHNLFRGLERAYGTWVINDKPESNGKFKGKARTVQTPVTDDLWEGHLSGSLGIGIVPITDESVCIWGAIDIDEYTGLDHVIMEKQVKLIEAPLLVIRSKSGGAHLYLFTSEPVPARMMQQRLRECALALGQPKAEIFPKQTTLNGDAGIGNWINMPYFQGDITTRYCVHKGRALTAEEFLQAAEASKINREGLQSLKPKAQAAEDWSDAPPCLEQLVNEGFPEGSRNNALLNLGLYAKKMLPDGEWQEKVHEWNQRWMSGTYAEVNGVIKAVSKSSYTYKCKDVPLCNICNKKVCYNRPYGISDGNGPPRRSNNKDDLPCVLDSVDRPVKVYRPPEGSHDEPQWTFTIAGKKMDVTLDMIMDQKKFLRVYASRFERLMLEVALPRWQADMNELLAEAEILELPADAGPEGQLMLHLEAFCTGKAQARDKNELLLGRPWTDEEQVTWFRSRDFLKYCDQQHFKSYREKEMFAVFRRHHGSNRKFMLKGKCVGAWGFPAFQEQTDDFDAVQIPLEEEKF